MAAVAALAWGSAGSLWTQDNRPQLAAVPSTVAGQGMVTVSNANGQVVIRDARLDELLVAHKQFGAASALQMPSGFLRNATFEESGR